MKSDVVKIRFEPEGRELEVPAGSNLRQIALDARLPLYSGLHRVLNCRGRGRCTGCLVRLTDGTAGNASARTMGERLRLVASRGAWVEGARLACQTQVHGDLVVETKVGMLASLRALARRLRSR